MRIGHVALYVNMSVSLCCSFLEYRSRVISQSIYRVNTTLFFSYNPSINNSFVSDCAFVFVVIFEIFVELSRSKLFQVITTPFGILKHTFFNFGMFVFY